MLVLKNIWLIKYAVPYNQEIADFLEYQNLEKNQSWPFPKIYGLLIIFMTLTHKQQGEG